MPAIVVETYISAPPELCFDMARDIGLHCATAGHTQERAVAGVTSGRIGMGQSVTFEGNHFGLQLRLTARVTEFDPPGSRNWWKTRPGLDHSTRTSTRARDHFVQCLAALPIRGSPTWTL